MHIIIRDLGLCHWLVTSEAMNNFTNIRNNWTFDELWLVEHYPVFTYGLSEKKILLNNIHDIPVFISNRGGKITYHGPGQLLVYVLLNLKRNKIKFKKFISDLEMMIIKLLNYFSISAHIIKNFRGVYINNKKVCSLGLRVSKGCSLHGLSLNVNMDLHPFKYINPCGYSNIKMTQLYFYNKNINISIVKKILIKIFCENFNFLKHCQYKVTLY